MQKALSTLLVFLLFTSTYSQSITDMSVVREGENIVIDYNLDYSIRAELYLWVSLDEGASWMGPLESVEGNVGGAIEQGKNQMIWSVTKDLDVFFGDKILFRIGSGTQNDDLLVDNRDGQTYKTVKIGTSVWMAENLRFDTKAGSSSYDNQEAYIEKYGRLYTWSAAKHACPNAWHLPLDSEWKNLIINHGGKKSAGINMKSETGWYGSKSLEYNVNQFSALPGGYCKGGSVFKDAGKKGMWWTADASYTSGSSAYSPTYAVYYLMESKNGDVANKTGPQSYSLSVRCVSDPIFYAQSEPAFYSIVNPECSIDKIPFEAFTINYMDDKMIEWQKQDPGERRSEYEFRTMGDKRKVKEQEFGRLAEKEYMKMIGKSVNWNDMELGYYNSLNETFQLYSELLGRFEVHVPINENPSFRQNFMRLKFEDPLFFIEEEKLRLTGLTITNPVNGKSYTYESPDRFKYDQLKTLTKYLGYDITEEIVIKEDNYIGEAQASATQANPAHIQQNIAPQTNVYTRPAPPRPKFGKYYALIIGINEYQDSYIQNLDEPINDADKLYNILTSNYTFDKNNVTFLKNPERGEIIQSLEELIDEVSPNDNLLIFFAGHGKWDKKLEIGYWLPADADYGSPINWLSNSYLRDYIKGIKSKHTLVIADACFSGGILKTRSISDRLPDINELSALRQYKLPSRKAMTSGTMETVPDVSIFMNSLTKRLIENESKYLSSVDLFSTFRTMVLHNTDNIPQYGAISNTGDEGGDFIFIRRDQPSY